MLTSFGQLRNVIKVKNYSIDNTAFRLHYRVTTIIFFIASVLVTSRQYIGEHIKCIADRGVPEHVMNTFCFFTTTFTLIKHYDPVLLERGDLPHPGVGPMGLNSTDGIKRHAYYQWVPFVLFAQALMFYIPHLVWKNIEGGRIRLLVEGLRTGVISSSDSIDYGPIHVPGASERDQKLEDIRRVFLERQEFNRSWTRWLIFCECLNFGNVFLQAFFIQEFLQGQFYDLGIHIIREGLGNTVDILDEVFPKVTKCTFKKYGPTGTIQIHDAMCIMALNVINEKIYVFLWFWLIFLVIVSGLAVLWRVLSIVLHARSKCFNRLVFGGWRPDKRNPWRFLSATKHSDYTGWLFLSYLSANMDPIIFRELFIQLAKELDDTYISNIKSASSRSEKKGDGTVANPPLIDFKIE